MSEENGSKFERRDVLKAAAASGALAFGGLGTASADHGGQGQGGPGNSEGGDDHGQGKSEGRGGNKGEGGGGGPDRVTGGSAFAPDGCYGGGETITITSMGGGTDEYWSGCEAAKEASAPANKTFQEYVVEGGCNLYIWENKPVYTGEDAEYYVVEVDTDCGPEYDKLGLEPAEEGSH